MTSASGIPPQRGRLEWDESDYTVIASAARSGQPNATQLEAVRATLRAIPMAAVAYTESFWIVDANHDCLSLLSLTPSQIRGRPIRDLLPESDLQHATDTARAVISATGGDGPRPTSSLRRLISGDGQDLTCWMHVGMAQIAGFSCFIACIDLVDPVLSDAHRWRHRAEHDELTGLRRRGAVLEQVGCWISGDHPVMLAFLDIDDFKSINDTHGHAAGDHVLTQLAHRLETHAPPGCAVGRLSGDEFVLALPIGNTHTYSTASTLLAEVGTRCVDQPIAWNNHLLMISISVGVTISERGESPSSLLSRADDAMYTQKSRQKAQAGRAVP